MFNRTGSSNNLNLKGAHQVFPRMGVLGQIQSNRTFATSPGVNNNKMNMSSNKIGIGMTEVSAKIINSDNGYPNNMRRTSVEESPYITSEFITMVGSTASSATTGSLAAGHVLSIIGCRSVTRTVSECPSEDSYIVFEGCDTDLEDCSDTQFEAISDSDDDDIQDEDDSHKDFSTSQKTDDIQSKKFNIKMVHFASDEHLVTVHPMVAWRFAYRASRKGQWEEFARDRERFNRRIECCKVMIEKILQEPHRERIYHERFAPLIANRPDTLNVSASDHNLIDKKQERPKRNRRRRNGKKKKKNRHKLHRKR